jgi:hypothetical protein
MEKTFLFLLETYEGFDDLELHALFSPLGGNQPVVSLQDILHPFIARLCSLECV